MPRREVLRYRTPAYVRSDAPPKKTNLPESGFYEIRSFLTGRPVGSVQLRGYSKSPVPVVAEHATSIDWRVIRLKNGHYVLEIDGKPTTEIDNYAAVLPTKDVEDYEEWVLQPETFYAGDGDDGTFMIKTEDGEHWWSIDPIQRVPVKCFPINHKPGPTPSERLFVFKPLSDNGIPRDDLESTYSDDEDDDYETDSASNPESKSVSRSESRIGSGSEKE